MNVPLCQYNIPRGALPSPALAGRAQTDPQERDALPQSYRMEKTPDRRARLGVAIAAGVTLVCWAASASLYAGGEKPLLKRCSSLQGRDA